ncbi:MAG: UDP-glucose/GDP-mannose dehydrogenase family protein [Ignavibacteria bacterium]|jgi:UDPglucose 6-dehydrogenase|nr:UDP-glucose/GDP-mannose dehydrogenase family protein [Ignavibacteria bacterium]
MSYRIGVIGTGYVGLVTGTCLADVGNSVVCIDVDPEKISRMRMGDTVIFEPGLDKLLERNLREERIVFSLDLEDAVRDCDILMLCLPTPPGKDGEADLDAVLSVSSRIALLLNEFNITSPRIIVNKSTVPVGTAARVREIYAREAPTRQVYVVSNPEFLRESFAVEEFMKPDRVIIGTSDEYAANVMRDLYAPFVRGGAPVLVFDERSAEVAKYAANSFLAVKISFMNDLSEYCEAVGADIEKVRIGIGTDNRIGRRFLFAGIGYGGSCFPKDVKALAFAARQAGTPLDIVEATQKVNTHQVDRFINKVESRFNNDVRGRQFALWGLAFKPNTDDIRDAPSFGIINKLTKAGASIKAYDPEAMDNSKRVLGDKVVFAHSPYDALLECDALIIATEWNEFRNPDFERMRKAMRQHIIFDGRNVFSLAEMKTEGFEYHSVGRAIVEPPRQ